MTWTHDVHTHVAFKSIVSSSSSSLSFSPKIDQAGFLTHFCVRSFSFVMERGDSSPLPFLALVPTFIELFIFIFYSSPAAFLPACPASPRPVPLGSTSRPHLGATSLLRGVLIPSCHWDPQRPLLRVIIRTRGSGRPVPMKR